MDLSKAFDIVGHSILHMKLSNYVIKATPLKWFADMNIKLQNVGPTRIYTESFTLLNLYKWPVNSVGGMSSEFIHIYFIYLSL